MISVCKQGSHKYLSSFRKGGGKSSVMSLIQHLYEPSSGRVLLDGIDVHNIAPQCVRDRS
jgi:ABC-type bacteriocin/lantibiotic exporter with double-glycine peptidase domain